MPKNRFRRYSVHLFTILLVVIAAWIVVKPRGVASTDHLPNRLWVLGENAIGDWASTEVNLAVRVRACGDGSGYFAASVGRDTIAFPVKRIGLQPASPSHRVERLTMDICTHFGVTQLTGEGSPGRIVLAEQDVLGLPRLRTRIELYPAQEPDRPVQRQLATLIDSLAACEMHSGSR
jgi:hypothetical protein